MIECFFSPPSPSVVVSFVVFFFGEPQNTSPAIMHQWRKFQFFEKELVKDPESQDPQRPIPHKILSVCCFPHPSFRFPLFSKHGTSHSNACTHRNFVRRASQVAEVFLFLVVCQQKQENSFSPLDTPQFTLHFNNPHPPHPQMDMARYHLWRGT